MATPPGPKGRPAGSEDPPPRGAIGLITGGLSGIGAATAIAFGRLGADVALLDVAPDRDDVVRAVREAGGSASVVACDVGDDDAVLDAVGALLERAGSIDFLVANAGIAEQSLAVNGDPARWQQVVRTNLLGAMHSVRAVLPAMREQRRGHIIIVASLSGREAYIGEPSYIASKWGLVGFAHAVRLEAERYGVRVTIVEPGAVSTPLTLGNDATRQMLEECEPLQPDDVAACIVFAYCQPPHVAVSEIAVRPLNAGRSELPWVEEALEGGNPRRRPGQPATGPTSASEYLPR